MPGEAPKSATSWIGRVARAANRSPALRALASLVGRWAELGTARYPPEDQRRLKILNVFAALVVLATGVYCVQNAFMDFERYKPIIVINLLLLVVAATLPALHRFG